MMSFNSIFSGKNTIKFSPFHEGTFSVGLIRMAIALVVLLWLGFLGILLNILMAQVPVVARWMTSLAGSPFIGTHFVVGVCASILALFGVVITMFYFIGTAKAVKEAVRDYKLDRGYYEMTLKYKKKYFPGMTLSLLFYIGLPSLGSAVMVDYLSPWIHGWFAYATLLMHGWICVRGQQYLIENDRLMAKVDWLVKKNEMGEKSKSEEEKTES